MGSPPDARVSPRRDTWVPPPHRLPPPHWDRTARATSLSRNNEAETSLGFSGGLLGPGVLPPAIWVLGGAGGVQGLQRLGQAGKFRAENGDLEEKKKGGEALTRTCTNKEPAGRGVPLPQR